jgi:hypothetical protein
MAGAKRKPLSLAGQRSEEDIDKVISGLSAGQDELSSIVGLSERSEAPRYESTKERVTYYLSSNTLESLENTYDEIRRNMPYRYKTKIKKSHLVDFAMENMLKEYEAEGRNSALGRLVEAVKRGESY